MVCKKRDNNNNFVHQNLINVHSNLINVHPNLINVHSHSKKQYTCDKCNKDYNTIKNYEEHIKKCKGLNILTCPKCMISFSSRFSKSNHIKRNNCKARSIIYANTTPQTNITNNNNSIITNSNNNNNTTNNFIINNFGNERTDYITFDDMIKLLKDNGSSIIPKYIQMKHYNKQFPENNNIKYDLRNGCLIKKNDKWQNIGIENISKKLINHNSGEINNFYNKNIDSIDKIFKDMQLLEYIVSKFNYLDLQLDKSYFNELKKEIKFIIKTNILI